MGDKDVEKLDPSHTTDGNTQQCSCCGYSAFLKKANTELSYNPAIPNLVCTPNKWNQGFEQKIHVCQPSQSPKEGMAHMSINRHTGKQCSLYTQWDVFSHRKEWSSDICCNVDKPRKHVQGEKPDKKGPILYDAIYMKYLEWENP